MYKRKPVRVLLVDDSAEVAELVEDYLSMDKITGYEMEWAKSYEAGQVAIARRDHDVYLIDYQLGSDDGLKLLKESIAAGCQAPMILLTGHGDRQIDVKAMQAGAADYLDKLELRPTHLERSIRYATERAQTINALRQSEERLRTVLDNVPVYVVTSDTNGIITSVTGRGGASDQSIQPEQMVGVRPIDMFGHHPQVVEHTKRSLSGESGSYVFDLGSMTIEVSYSPMQDVTGKFIGVIGVAADISERRAIERAEQEQRVLAEALRDTAAILTSTLDFEEVLDRILEIVGRVLPHDAASIMMIDQGMAQIVRAKGFPYDQDMVASRAMRFDVQKTVGFREIIRSQEPMLIADTRNYSDWHQPPDMAPILSWVGLPILIEGEVIGFLNLDSQTPDFFTQAAIERLRAFSDQIAIAVRNAWLYKRAQELAAIEERQRLARELHDAVSQTLFSASMMAESLPRLWENIPPRAAKRLGELHRLTRLALLEMRSLLLELRPHALVETPIAELTRQIAETFANRTRAEVSVTADDRIHLEPDTQLMVYRILQESLNNIAKHARATQVTIHLGREDGHCVLSVQDNGQGFDDARTTPGHFGLKIMQERAEQIDGAFQLETAPGQGTIIRLVWSKG